MSEKEIGQKMCPHCGWLYSDQIPGLVPMHVDQTLDTIYCKGSEQNPRNPEADRRPLWNSLPNPHIKNEPDKMLRPVLSEARRRSLRLVMETADKAIESAIASLVQVAKEFILDDFCTSAREKVAVHGYDVHKALLEIIGKLK